MGFDLTSVADISLWAYILVFFGGIITSAGPCNVAMIPLVMAFVGGQRTPGRGRSLALSVSFALGLAITLTLLGVIAALVGGLIGGSSRIWYYLVAAVCIIMGSQWAGIITLPIPDSAARLRQRVTQRGALGALLLGLASGLVASGCATPALAAILALVMSEGAIVYGASLLLVYGLGRGVPIVLVGTFTGAIKMVPQFLRWSWGIERGSGVLMIGIGLYFLWLA